MDNCKGNIGKLHKTPSIGVWSGMEMKNSQKYPSHLFMMENSQISVDNEIAEIIYVGALGE